ncbi:MAG: caspase family protein, partial [Spirochaetota bacterium]
MKAVYTAMVFCFLSFFGCSFFGGVGNTAFHALVIGINQYNDPAINDLDYCVNDANGIHDSLIQNGWKEEEITLLLDGEATKTAILSAINSIVGDANPNDYILIFYSGHGTAIADSDGDESDGIDEAIVPVDYIYGNASTLILDDDIGKSFSTCRTEKGVFIFDSCNSGGFINMALGTGGEAQARYVHVMDIKGSGTNGDLDILNLPVMTSSDETEYSFELPALQHGVFSYFILAGLKNRNADTNDDAFITIRELFDYAKSQTEFFTSYQHPKLRFPRELIDILITR